MVAPGEQIEAICAAAHPLWEEPAASDPLLGAIGDSQIVMIGEASHGTHEFYAARALITRRLIEERDFSAVVVEADWPDAYRVSRFVRGFHDDPDAAAALGGFRRFPQWMWRNSDVLDFVRWLHAYNESLVAAAPRVGFYGMDLYSLYASIESVLAYLDKVDHVAATRARFRYSCFGHFASDPQTYGYSASTDAERSCEEEAVRQLLDLHAHSAQYTRRDGRIAEDEYFQAEQNARLVKDAEEYYREMYRGRVSSWNLRDRHMAGTIAALRKYLERQHSPAKLVIWAHNSHLGDARATEMHDAGEINVGQLMRETFGPQAFNIGFSTHAGAVTAAANWDDPAETMRVLPSLPGSYERLFHDTGLPHFLLLLRGDFAAGPVLREPRLQRAIGVIYRRRPSG
jgi:erythromycin esterase-like protein